MRGLTRIVLLLLGTCLTLWLILGFWPLGINNRVALSVLVIIISGALSYVQWRKINNSKQTQAHIVDSALPPEDFQGAVVLVCGDSAALFSDSIRFRETRLGWYLPVKLPEHLPLLAQYLSAERPALIAQVSVMLAVIPEQHQDRDDFAQSIRVWQRTIVQCKEWLAGTPPLWVSSWLSPPTVTSELSECWYTVTPGYKGIQVQETGAGVLPLVEWTQQQGFPQNQHRLSSAFWMEALQLWLNEHVFHALSQREGDVQALVPYAWGNCFTPVKGCTNNLWQSHIAEFTTLPPQISTTSACLPLPEVLLPYLPRRRGISRLMQIWQLAGLLCGIFLLFALLASFINNQRLIQSINDHLVSYNRLTGIPPVPKSLAQQQLSRDSRLLDDWLRSGVPMRLSLGLYQGIRLMAPLEAAINSWAPPPPPPSIIKKIVQGPKTVRLDSLSLFDVGRFVLKTGSNKVLINALVGIKAKPGWLIVIAGHTDDTGNDKSNQLLSLKRAASVRDWMSDTGDIPESCFAVQGYGESRPLKPNDTAEGRAANRRVEISLVPQANACQATASQSTSGSEVATTPSKEN